jgi:hypothetical protein
VIIVVKNVILIFDSFAGWFTFFQFGSSTPGFEEVKNIFSISLPKIVDTSEPSSVEQIRLLLFCPWQLSAIRKWLTCLNGTLPVDNQSIRNLLADMRQSADIGQWKWGSLLTLVLMGYLPKRNRSLKGQWMTPSWLRH